MTGRLAQLPGLLLALAVTLAGLPGGALAQAPAAQETRVRDPDIEALIKAYDYANYLQVLERAQLRIDRGGLAREDLVDLHKYAGLSAFNLGKQEVAERHLSALLRLSPDYNLDPFAVAPTAIAFFEELRKKLEPQLELIRQQLRIDAERLRREEEARLQREKDEEERRRRLEELSRRITVRNVEKRSFLVNFVPFGAGQFQQGRVAHGVVLAATQGALALTSVIALLAYEGIVVETTRDFDTVKGPITVEYRYVPRDREAEARTWRWVNYAAAGGFYALYSYGVVDAIYHHQDEVVTTTTLQLPPDTQRLQPKRRKPRPDPREPPPPPEEEKDTVPLGPQLRGDARDLSLTPLLFPTPGGVGAGFHLQF